MMTVSRHCGDVLVIVTLILAVIFILISILMYFCTSSVVPNLTNLLEMLKCTSRPSQREIYQHSGFWVLQNFAQVSGPIMCATVTMAMQGDYRDIYKLKNLYLGDFSKEFVSFSVYLEDENDWNQTIEAIATMRNCFRFFKYDTIVRPVYDLVSFHLYFPYGFVLQKDQLQVARTLIHDYDSCTQMDKFSDDRYSETVDTNPHAVIVGRNIAQLSTSTMMVLPFDSNTYLSQGFLPSMYFENIAQYKLNSRKFVLRLPTIILQHMSVDHQLARSPLNLLNFNQTYPKTLVANWNEFDTPEWLMPVHQMHKPIAFRDIVNTLSLYLSYYVGDPKSFPLLDERKGLTVKQADTLQFYQMCLENFTLYVPTRLYVVHNISDTDALQEPVHSLTQIDPAIIKEMNAMLDNGNKECMI